MSWTRTRANRAFTAVTLMAGRVSRTYSWTGGVLAEGIHWIGNQAVYGRYGAAGVGACVSAHQAVTLGRAGRTSSLRPRLEPHADDAEPARAEVRCDLFDTGHG